MSPVRTLAAAVSLVVVHAFGGSSPAAAHPSLCGGLAPLQVRCDVPHAPWQVAEPEPVVQWVPGFNGMVEAKVVGASGATSTRTCNVVNGSASCSTPQNDTLVCCTETWRLVCLAVGVGNWGCGHTGG